MREKRREVELALARGRRKAVRRERWRMVTGAIVSIKRCCMKRRGFNHKFSAGEVDRRNIRVCLYDIGIRHSTFILEMDFEITPVWRKFCL